VIYDLQNIHPKWVAAKIFFLKDLRGKRESPGEYAGVFLISITAVAGWVDLIGQYILFCLCGLGDFGFDKESSE
jgi:hypothetical protein